MSRINFISVSMRNFFSYGNVPTVVSLDGANFTVIRGKNGSGKSTISDALCFALFNKPYKKVNKSGIVNNLNKKNCVVELEFSIGSRLYKIIRGIKPNVFEIYCDGILINPPTDSRDYQKVLETQILRMTYKTFVQIVILGISGFVPFMELSAAVRREIVDDLLDAEVYTDMSEILKERIKKTREEMLQLSTELRGIESKMDSLNSVKKTLLEDKAGQVAKIQEEIRTNLEAIDSLGRDFVDISNKISELESKCPPDDITTKLTKFKTYYQQINTKRNTLYANKKWYLETTDCPTCKQKIFEESKNTMVTGIDASIQEMEAGIVDLKKKIETFSAAYATQQEILVELNKLEKERSSVTNKTLALTNLNTRLEKQATELLSSQNVNLDSVCHEIDSTETLRVAKKKTLSELERESSIQQMAATMLKDGGIKSDIIKQYIPVFNHLVNKYLGLLDLFVSFELDENFNECVKARHREEFTYDSFSQGQKSRINLAILFAWRQIAALKHSASTNILILDEVFDSSLDYEGTFNLRDLLTSELGDVKLFVVTHNNDASFDEFFDRRLDVSLVNGYTSITETV